MTLRSRITPFITRAHAMLLLLAGVILITAANLIYSVDLIAWIASVPFLAYLTATKGIRSRLVFVLFLILAWSFCTWKIITPPISGVFVFLFSIPIALVQIPGYLTWAYYRNTKWSFILFPSVMTIMEWIQYTFTPFASWGAAAYSQSHSLPIMQSVSLFGMPGLSFMVYWVNVSVAEFLLEKKSSVFTLHVPALVLSGIIIFGFLRIDLSATKGKDTIAVAAVGTDSHVNGLPLPPRQNNEAAIAKLFERTRLAARSHARLIVWNEASCYIHPEDEQRWRDSLSVLASKLSIYLVASYVKPVSGSPLRYENMFLFIMPDGVIAQTYHKHEPVPGEPAIRGREPLKILNVDGSKTGGVICYDYDFPYLAATLGALQADIVAVPSSDWRGIDPLHTKMAAYRAVERGHSILRSARFGLSAAITPYGEMVSVMSSFDNNEKIMIAQLPRTGVKTVYNLIGDKFVCLCAGFIILFFAYRFRSRNATSPDE